MRRHTPVDRQKGIRAHPDDRLVEVDAALEAHRRGTPLVGEWVGRVGWWDGAGRGAVRVDCGRGLRAWIAGLNG